MGVSVNESWWGVRARCNRVMRPGACTFSLLGLRSDRGLHSEYAEPKADRRRTGLLRLWISETT